MKTAFSRNLIVVGSVHLVLVLGLTALALVHGCRRAQPAALAYMPIEFVAEVPAAPPSIVPKAAPPPPPTKAVKTTPTRKTPRKAPRKRPKKTSQSEIEKMLDLGTAEVTNVRPLKNDAMYRAIIDQTYRREWEPPSYSEVGDATTFVSVYLRQDGTLKKYDLRSSGNALLDSSVREVMKKVLRIPGLSGDYIARNKAIPIKFQAEK